MCLISLSKKNVRDFPSSDALLWCLLRRFAWIKNSYRKHTYPTHINSHSYRLCISIRTYANATPSLESSRTKKERKMFCAYRRIPFPEVFITERIKHENQHRKLKKFLSYQSFAIAKLFFLYGMLGRVSEWVNVFLINISFVEARCIFLIAGWR